MFDVSAFSKAIAGGLAGLVIAELAHFGFQPDAATVSAIAVVVTGVVGYVVGHVVVYLSPKNK